MAQIEFDYYIPPDVVINDDGTINDYTNVYNFHNDYDRILMSFSGYGFPTMDHIVQQGPFQNGKTLIDYRLNPRTILFVHKRMGTCRCDYWSNRSELINILRPNRQLQDEFSLGTLRKILPNGDVRDLKVITSRGPRFNPRETEWAEFDFVESIQFTAYDPILTDPELQSAIWELGDLSNLIFYESVNWENKLVFEGDDLFSGGIWFGDSSIASTLSVEYNGTWESYPTIYITGPLSTPKIYNNTTGKSVKLEYIISSGETVTINLEYGQRTIMNNFGENLIGTATVDSDFAEFAIVPEPSAPGGVNDLQVVGDYAAAGETEIRVSWNTKYIGI